MESYVDLNGCLIMSNPVIKDLDSSDILKIEKRAIRKIWRDRATLQKVMDGTISRVWKGRRRSKKRSEL